MFLLEAIGFWFVLSCLLGPCVTWMFFYGKRQARTAERNRKSQYRLIEYRPALQLTFRKSPRLAFAPRRAAR